MERQSCLYSRFVLDIQDKKRDGTALSYLELILLCQLEFPHGTLDSLETTSFYEYKSSARLSRYLRWTYFCLGHP